MRIFQRSRAKQLLTEMEQAQSYEQWAELAEAYDEENGLDEWKRDDACECYDYRDRKSVV